MSTRQVLQRQMPTQALADSQKNVQATCRRATRRGIVQGPTAEGGLSHLLPTNARKIDTLYLAPTRDDYVRAYQRLRDCK